jgi:RHS repeat-associated protein
MKSKSLFYLGMTILRTLVCTLLLTPLVFDFSFAAICTDCCYISGDPDGQYTNGTYYKDLGGLRQTQKLTNSGGGCSGGCYATASIAEGGMYSCAEHQYSYCQSKGNVTPCLTLPQNNLLYGTAYGYIDQCRRGGYYYWATAYWLETTVICLDNKIDSDGDGIVDCEDSTPFDEAANDFSYLEKGIDPSDPQDKCGNNFSRKGNPTSIYTGNKMESEKDLSVNSPFAGGFSFERFYNSQSEDISLMGYGWTHNYNITLQLKSNKLLIVDDTGFGRYFSKDAHTGEIAALFNERTSLAAGPGTYTWRREDGRAYTFDASSYQLLYIEDQIGNRQRLTYDETDSKLLNRIVDEASSRSLEFTYTDGLLTTIRLHSGTVDVGVMVTYGHDDNGNLTRATFADGSGFVYEYNDSDNDPNTAPFINNMTRKTDAAGHLLATWAYDDQDRCDYNKTGDDRGVEIDYDTTDDAVIVTDAYGISRTYRLTSINGRKRIAYVSDGSGCSSCVDEPIGWEYDDELNVIKIEYANGRIDRFSDFDDRGHAGTVIRAADTDEEKTLTFTWHPAVNQLLTQTESSVLVDGSKVITWDYDADGDTIANENPTSLVHRIIVSGFTQDSSGSVVSVESITRFSYNSHGQVLSINGPLAGIMDTTTFTYDSATGDLLTVTRPVSGTSTFSEYDAAGKPGQATDSNRNSVVYTYDGRGRLATLTRLWDNTVASYTYTLAGKPDTVRLPNGITLTYAYESVYGRLTAITDALGNKIGYAYDDQGNVIETAYYLPSEAKIFWQGFDYQYPDRPGRLWKKINPDKTYFEYAYDAMGNLSQITDPEGKITTYSHDPFNRRESMVQPGTVTTGYDYDSHGNLVLVTDPAANSTNYVVDDLGRRVTTVSPDTGATHYAYDAAGNMVSKTDARGITLKFTYDAEYRLTHIHCPDASQDVVFTYDEGPNGKGRLTGMIDASGSYMYGWDEAGNRLFEQKTISGVTYTTAYGYDEIGLLTTMTYSDGTIVSWQRDDAGNINRVTKNYDGHTTVLADNIKYMPFGPLQTMTLGNGVAVNRSFDMIYRMTGNVDSGIQNYGYDFDPMGNITAIDDGMDSERSQFFDYDDLYRLTNATGIYGSIEFSMDDVGNRLTLAGDDRTERCQYLPATNLLNSITKTQWVGKHGRFRDDFRSNTKNARSNPQASRRDSRHKSFIKESIADISTDAAGNIVAAGNQTYIYDQANRLTEVRENYRTLSRYVYSADGRRTQKITRKQVTTFHYDLEGRLISESDDQGKLTRMYIYLNGMPLAQIRSNNSSNHEHPSNGKGLKNRYWKNAFSFLYKHHKKNWQKRQRVYYYHTDHIGTPQRMTDAKASIVWAADYQPFGEVDITVETVTSNLRFAGQYCDTETGLHYNYHRYYVPATGRYLTPDPIGLAGGINLYAYVQNDPVNSIDSFGLWPTQGGAYIHQRAIYMTIGRHLPREKHMILVQGQVFADSTPFQGADTAFRHAMRNPGQARVGARSLADEFVRQQFKKAWQLKARGCEDQSLFEFSVGLHTLQDSTSPSHFGFQMWADDLPFGDVTIHITKELFNPGEGSELYRITGDAWKWYNHGYLPSGNLFMYYGKD